MENQLPFGLTYSLYIAEKSIDLSYQLISAEKSSATWPNKIYRLVMENQLPFGLTYSLYIAEKSINALHKLSIDQC